MTNTEKALALINTFANGNADEAYSLLREDYIQHNLAYGTGRDAFVGSVKYLASAPVKTTVNNIRAYEDGNKVFLQTVYNFAGMGEQVGFDIFRFAENGKIAEHWDNLAAKAAPNPSGRTQIDNYALNLYIQKKMECSAENREELFLSLRNQKCQVYKSRVITCEAVSRANEFYDAFNINCPLAFKKEGDHLTPQNQIDKHPSFE
ncbi:MAG: nuclear transport factor 2 family protein [Bulleidia sp.]|nr:nuclear transport factor 2 family protein [Bulleidia sp.]